MLKHDPIYELMFEEIEDYAILVIDTEGMVRNWNKGAEKIKGYKAEEIIGKNFAVFYTKEDREKKLPEKLLKKASQEGKATAEGWRIRKDGTRFWGSILITAIRDKDKKIIGFSKVTRDLTDKKELEDSLEKALSEAKQAANVNEGYHKMIEEVEDYAILLLDIQGNIKNWNKGAEKIKGYKASEIIGKNFATFYTTEDRERNLPEQLIRKAALEGKAASEGWRVRKDGTRFWGNILITAIHNKDNEVIGFSKVTRDLSERKKAEESLLNQKNLYETLLKTESEMGQGVSITEGEKIIYVNDAVCNIYGYSREEILSFSSFLSIIPHEEKPLLIEKLSQRIKGIRVQTSGETKVIRKDGKIIDLEYTVRNIDVDGHMQMLSIIKDVTEKKQNEKQLSKEKERAESAEIAKRIGEQFLANMSHEIRTPMNAILGFIDILRKTPLTTEQNKYIKAIKISGDNLLVIINDILDLSRIRSGKMPIENRSFKLSKIISMSSELMLPNATEKGLKLSVNIDRNIHEDLIGDPTRLNQILLNLVSNAIKFTSEGEVRVKVKLLEDTTNEVTLEFIVQDSGIGISKDKLATIFEAFMQADNDISRTYGGTGLGLAIVKQLVELQGGSIGVSSEEGEGSRFYFTLKYKKTTIPEEDDATASKAPVTKIKSLKVLLVEDNEMNQLLARKVLGDFGWHIEIAENGIEAIEKVKNADFDIVLMDIQMPEMDGYETTRQIRQRFPVPKCNIPILAMTAHVLKTEEEKCYQAGMNGYISKPFDVETLYYKIATIVEN